MADDEDEEDQAVAAAGAADSGFAPSSIAQGSVSEPVSPSLSSPAQERSSSKSQPAPFSS